MGIGKGLGCGTSIHRILSPVSGSEAQQGLLESTPVKLPMQTQEAPLISWGFTCGKGTNMTAMLAESFLLRLPICLF